MRAIFHADINWGIGRGNSLMFTLPKDMRFFRDSTLGKVVVMGLNTLRSFPNGKPLKDRFNIVLSPEDVEGTKTVHSLSELFELVKKFPPEDVFVIGGASVYRTLLPYCNEAFVTKVEEDGHADVFAPNLDKDPSFELVSCSLPEFDNGHLIRFCTYRNRSPLPLP